MTLPPFMKNTPISDDALAYEYCIEADVVFALAHKLTHFKYDNAFKPHFDKCPPADAGNIVGLPNQAVEGNIADPACVNFQTVTPPPVENIVGLPNQAFECNTIDPACVNLQTVTPPPTPKPEQLNTKVKAKARTSRPCCSLPNSKDPMDDSFCMTLHSTKDKGKINPTHYVIRRDVLEVRRTKSGKIFFQCACCKHVPRRKRAKCSTVSPQHVRSLYSAMVRFMMYHVPACEHVPQEIKDLSPKATRDVKVTGTKAYWFRSAMLKGLKDSHDGSIVYSHPSEN